MQAIGPMRHRAEIQVPTEERDSFGATMLTWTTCAVRACEKIDLAGRELFHAAQVRPDVTHKVTLRYFEGLTMRHRFVIDGETHEITSVTEDGRKRFHECLTTRRAL